MGVFPGHMFCRFKSIGEINHAIWLEAQRRAGKIKRWEHEKRYSLVKNKNGFLTKHEPDFTVVLNNNRKEVHEIKEGYYASTASWLHKKRQFERIYPNIKYIVVDKPKRFTKETKNKKWFQLLSKKISEERQRQGI